MAGSVVNHKLKRLKECRRCRQVYSLIIKYDYTWQENDRIVVRQQQLST